MAKSFYKTLKDLLPRQELSMSIEHAETIAYVLSRYVEGARLDGNAAPDSASSATCRTRRK